MTTALFESVAASLQIKIYTKQFGPGGFLHINININVYDHIEISAITQIFQEITCSEIVLAEPIAIPNIEVMAIIECLALIFRVFVISII